MFLVAVIALGFFLRKQAKRGILFATMGLLPVVVYGVIAQLHGWPFLPTSVLLKAGLSPPTDYHSLAGDLWHHGLANLWEGRHLAALMILALLLDRMAKSGAGLAWDTKRVMTGIFVGVGILHLGLARVGWFYRYEAYLVALGIVVVACRFSTLTEILGVPAASHPGAKAQLVKIGAALLLMISLFFSLIRGTTALANIPQATANLYEQQYQMAAFIRRSYQHSTIALNDIGAVNFFADIHCLDLWGLGTPAVARLRMQRIYRREDISRLAAHSGARIAIVYDSWFEKLGGLPAEWTRVGQWRILNNVVNGSDTVSIYAIDPREVGPLTARLAEFSSELPSDVVPSGLYLQFQPSGN